MKASNALNVNSLKEDPTIEQEHEPVSSQQPPTERWLPAPLSPDRPVEGQQLCAFSDDYGIVENKFDRVPQAFAERRSEVS